MDERTKIPLKSLTPDNLCQIFSKMKTKSFLNMRYANKGVAKCINDNRRQIHIRISLDHRSRLVFNGATQEITLRISRPLTFVRDFPPRELHYLTVYKAEIMSANTPEEREWLSNILRRATFKATEQVVYDNVDFAADMFVRSTVAKLLDTCKVNGSVLGEIGVPPETQWLQLAQFRQLEAYIPSLYDSVLIDVAKAFVDLKLENLIGWTFHVTTPTRDPLNIRLIPGMKDYQPMIRRHLAGRTMHPVNDTFDILALYTVRNRADSVLFIRTGQFSIELGRMSGMNDMTLHMNALAAIRFMGFFWTHKCTDYWK